MACGQSSQLGVRRISLRLVGYYARTFLDVIWILEPPQVDKPRNQRQSVEGERCSESSRSTLENPTARIRGKGNNGRSEVQQTTYPSPSNLKAMNIDDIEEKLGILLPWVVLGVVLALFIGACLTLGTICLILLSSPTGDPPKQRRLLRLYIVALIIAVISHFLCNFFADNILAIFRPHTELDLHLLGYRLGLAFTVVQSIVIWMVDGLLVWRCYMVQKIFTGHSSPFRSIMFLGVVVAGIITWVTGLAIPEAVFFTSNALTNIYGTAFVITRLLRHRRMARICFGDKASTGRCRRIARILLESAAINCPKPVIHRVALGRAIGQQSEKEVALVVESKLHNAPKNIQIPLPVA
ncbi:hypothetical protein P691DRAFT_787812 [Macrolepiota fuliginosa MF-IS2]|uniref:Uncharacterized protein n=1 Tax=Macrolepiota fuliginosa MF-IS2 TaxID=1400762 RepID=A0A9P6BZI0_9AGAR|nr:hypothetical protein P691DRAFT_787812 [Macrolepiota fuliginosa MF-IS2]